MMLIVKILLIVNRYKMENLKTNWKLPEKIKNPRSQREISCEEIENILKTAEKSWNFCWKTAKAGGRGRGNLSQTAQQKSPTAWKRLDISIKRTLKIGHRLCWFCAMQQRKKPMTFFMSQAFGAPEGTRTPDLLIRRDLWNFFWFFFLACFSYLRVFFARIFRLIISFLCFFWNLSAK